MPKIRAKSIVACLFFFVLPFRLVSIYTTLYVHITSGFPRADALSESFKIDDLGGQLAAIEVGSSRGQVADA